MRGWAKGRRFPPMTQILPLPLPRLTRPNRAIWVAAGVGLLCAGVVGGIGPARLIAQIEGDRGIAPVLNTGDIEVTGVQVNATGKTAQEARAEGWKAAYRAAWAKVNGPALGDGELSAMVTRVSVQNEQIGPHRYIATLGVSFDRARAAGFVAGGSGGQRSAPMLVIPVLISGGAGQVYEIKGAWQRAWAEFRTGASAVDYVRPSGAGGDSLLITAGQPGRRSRLWWRGLLDQYGASDVLMPEARLERQWPGGPIVGTFNARYGPDNRHLAAFTLTAADESELPAMLTQAVQQMDRLYSGAVQSGQLRADGISIDHPAVDPGLASVIAAGERAAAAEAAARVPVADSTGDAVTASGAPLASPVAAEATSVSVQFASPDARSVDAALAGVRGTSGVASASTSSIAIGGTSVMRVSYNGSIAQLAAALRERGWQVTVGSGALRIRRNEP